MSNDETVPPIAVANIKQRLSMDDNPASMRFAIMCDGNVVEDWQARCIRYLLALENLEPALVILRATSPGGRSVGRAGAGAFPRMSLWDWYYRFYVCRRARAKRLIRASDVLPGVPTLTTRVVLDERGFASLREEDIAEIRAHDLDFILQFGFETLRGDILSAARHGVWSFRHDTEQRHFGRPPFFWELYSPDRRVHIALERLTEVPGEQIVLQSGTIKTVRHSYAQTIDSALYRVLEWPARVCKDLRNGTGPSMTATSATPARLPGTKPTNGQMIHLGLKLAGRFVSSLMTFLFLEEQWNVGVVHAPIHTFLTPGARPPVQWLPKVDRNRFLADPFVLTEDGGVTILLEEFDQRAGKGHISAVRISREGEISAPVPVLETASHMAYPFIVKHRGEVYCVPDTSHAGEVALYRAASFPTGWERVATLLEGFPGCDSTIFQYDGRWWLFCSGNDTGVDMAASKSHITGVHTTLYAWYADDLLGPWKPHPANPLKVDIGSSRPAGTPFVYEGTLYRPAQDSSSTYGGATVINRMIKLTPAEFYEEPAIVVKPYSDSPYNKGLHTISGSGDITVIDGKRMIFYPSNLATKVRLLAGRVFHADAKRGHPALSIPRETYEDASVNRT